MTSCDAPVEKLYLIPKHEFTLEQMLFWYISHLGQKFVYSPEQRIFKLICHKSEGQQGTLDYLFHSMVQIASVQPFVSQQANTAFAYDLDTQILSIRPEQKYVIVIDLSSSLFHASSDGNCHVNDALRVLDSVLHQFVAAPNVSLPGSHFSLRRLTFLVSVIAVVPSVRCYTLMSGWIASTNEIHVKMRHISRLLIKIERKLLTNCDEVNRIKDTASTSLTDLLRHGILAASSMAPNNEPCSMLVITDGCLSIPSVEILDRSLIHLRYEGIRCSFVVLGSNPSSSSSIFPSNTEGSALCYSTRTSVFLPQIDLCSLLAHSTSGFCITTTELEHLIANSHGGWNELLELLVSTRLVCRHNALDGNLNWVPGGTLETQRRFVRASVPHILIARLRDGYKLRRARVLRYGNSTISEPNNSLNKSGTETQMESAKQRSDQCLFNLVHLELTMLWKVGITFIIHIRGLWPDLHRIAELEKINFGLNDTVAEPSLPYQLKTRSTDDTSTYSFRACQVSFSISANYSFLHEVTCKRKLPIQNANRASTISRFVMYHRHLSVTDQQIEHVFSFWRNGSLAKVEEQLPSGLSSVFTVIPDTSGKLIAVPSLLAHRLSGNHDVNLALAENNSQFFHFWRLFIERDLLECYRWLKLQNIYGILEHDSPLSPNLHLPPEGDRYTATLTCRQSLNRLHAFLSQWSTFTLLEGTVYVRLLYLEDDEAVRLAPCMSDVSSVGESQKPAASSDVGFTSTLRPTSSNRLSFFCIVRVELKIPEFRVRIGFVIGTPLRLQHEVTSQLREQIAALRFPPRGRQAIPKSRHKSGAPLPNTEGNAVPPLQRSWEDTPCCTIFRNRLDRLIVNTGVWSKRLSIGYRSLTSNVGLSGDRHSESSDRLADQQLKDCCSLGSIQRPGLELTLLSQHLHHDSKIWVIQPTAFSDEALRLLFSSLLNIRLQEGFHLVRVGPQTGFVSLATEIWLSSTNKSKKIKCLVQYQLYPLGNTRMNDTDTGVVPSFSAMESSLKEAVSQVIVNQRRKCSSSDAISHSIFDLPRNASERVDHPFRNLQLVTELWIQPIEGGVTSCSLETRHWENASFTELSKRIFDVDRCCVLAYTTLERLGAVLRSSVPTTAPIHAATGTSVVHVKVDSVLGSLAPEASVEWARTCLPRLISLSPQVVLLYSFLQSRSCKTSDRSISIANSVANDFLLSQFCEFILSANEAREIYFSAEDSKDYTERLCEQAGINRDQVLSDNGEPPQWRCFILPSLISSDMEHNVNPPENFLCNPLVTIVFLPKLYTHATTDTVRQITSNIGLIEDVSLDIPFLPVFVYACSRVYLSYLIDDRWTYKVPPMSFFDLRHSGTYGRTMADAFSYIPLLEVPEKFLGVGCQNLRLTQELNLLWSNLRQTIRFLSHVHLDSFIFSVYHCLNRQIPLAERDVEYVVHRIKPRTTSQPLSIDINPLLLLTCEYFLSGLRQRLCESTGNTSSATEALLTTLLNGEPIVPESGSVFQIPLHTENEIDRVICNCCAKRPVGYRKIMNHYLRKLENHDGLFILTKKHYTLPENQMTAGQSGLDAVELEQFQKNSDPKARLVSSGNTSDSESVSGTDIENGRQKVSTKRKQSPTADLENSMVHMVKQWFDATVVNTTSNTDLAQSEGTLFVKMFGVLTYGTQSAEVPLTEGLPLFCFLQVKNKLIELVKSQTSEWTPGVFLVDPMILKFQIHLSVLHWPRCFSSQTILHSNELNRDKESVKLLEQRNTHSALSTTNINTNDDYFVPVSVEDATNVLCSWSSQPDLSLLTSFQRAIISQFVVRLLWQMEDDIVSSLRTLTPVLIPSMEFALRHIENTDRLCQTPLFAECGLMFTDTHRVCLSHIDSNGTIPQQLLVDTSLRRNNPLSHSIHPQTEYFVEPRKLIKIDRIPLDFVTFSPEIFSYFVQQFEKISFSSAHASLEYLGGYYFLRSMFMSPDTAASKCNNGKMNKDLSRSETHDLVENLPDSTSDSLSGRKFRHRTSDQTCYTSRPVYLSHAVDNFNGSLWFGAKNSVVKIHPRRFSSRPQPHQKQRYPQISIHAPNNLGYEGDSSDLGEELETGSCPARIPCQIRSRRSTGIRTKSEGSKTPLEDCNRSDSGRALSGHHTVAPYWLIFRVCANSVSLFFHHQSSSVEVGRSSRYLAHTDPNLAQSLSQLYDSSSTLIPFICEHCDTFTFACKSIHTVTKLVNQRILLNKLCNERLCDELLMPVPKLCDPYKNPNSGRKGFRSITDDKYLKSSVGRSRGLQSPNTKSHRAKPLHPVNSSSADSSCEEVTDPTCTTRIGREKKTRANVLASMQHRVSFVSNGCSVGAWPPGYFACPVQMVSYIGVHPRVLAATAHVGQVDRGRRIVSALRCLLEKPAIRNRPDMFFLIDRAPRTLSTKRSTNFVSTSSHHSLATDTVGSLDEVPVFYFILKEGTSQSFKADPVGGSYHDKLDSNPSTAADPETGEIESVDDPQSSVDDSKFKKTSKVVRFPSPTHPASRSRNATDIMLQITLHGIDTPSRRLCSFVRRMLQQLLDDLVLQHFSDVLSRNAINRLTLEDLNFLSNGRPLAPQQEYLIALPRFLCNPTEFCRNVPYGSRQLVLAFCHYLRQNLLLFLAAVKLDSTAQAFTGPEPVELFLYNRPRAQGVAKPGVATLSFRLVTPTLDPQGLTEIHPYKVTDWTLPCEPVSIPAGHEALTVEQLQKAVVDVYEWNRDHSSQTDTTIEKRLILSLHIWQHGDADLNRLKARVRTAVLHSLYDLLTEFFVLTSPTKLRRLCPNSVQSGTSLTEICEDGIAEQMNPHLASVILPWFEHGKRLESPLIVKTEVILSSGILLDQFVTDFLSPFATSVKLATGASDDSGLTSAGAGTTKPGQSVTTTPLGPGIITSPITPDWYPNEVFFHVFIQQNKSASGYLLKQKLQQQRAKRPSSAAIATRPGVSHEYLAVGRNITAWRRLVQRASGDPEGVGGYESTERLRWERSATIAPDFDMLLRMQPLQVILMIPAKNSITRNVHTPTPSSDHSVHPPNMDEPGTTVRTQTAPTNSTGWSQTANGLGTELTGSSLPAASRFPEFCPVQLISSQTTLQTPVVLTNTSPRVFSMTTTQQQSQQQQSQTAPTDPAESNSTPAPNETVSVLVQVPRQSLCVLKFTSRLVTVFTYNWSKEEADRFSYRLTSLSDWYNRRLKLLQCLSNQKLGLFHELNHPAARWCATHAPELIRNPCPFELLTYPDSILTVMPSRAIPTTPANSTLGGQPVPGSVCGLRAHGTGGANATGSGVGGASSGVVGGSGGSGTRRRHPTSSGEFVPSVGHPAIASANTAHLYSTSPTGSFQPNSTTVTDANSIKNVTNFLRLFQDCSRIPQLKPPNTVDFNGGDLVFRHGLQALTAIEFDRRRAQRLELLTLPFRAWQEGRKRRMTGNHGSNKSSPKPTKLLGTTTAMKSDGPFQSTLRISDAETALANEPLNKQLKRFSAIRLACRHLHTICAPVLFCPRVRAQAVQLTQSETAVLTKVAEACYRWFRESSGSTGKIKDVERPASETSTAKTSVSSADNPPSCKLRDLVTNPRRTAPGLHRVQSSIIAPTTTELTQLSATKMRISASGLHSASPWLNWSRSTLFDELSQARHALENAQEIWPSPETNSVGSDTGTSSGWERRICAAFLAQYAQYVQAEVGFRSVVVNAPATRSSRGGNAQGIGMTGRSSTCSYGLFHRAIHLAGVHIMEIFIRNCHLYVRLGTIELSRFSRHASRALIAGPLSAEVITQAAASAAASVASVMRDAASGLPEPHSSLYLGSPSPISSTTSTKLESKPFATKPPFERSHYASGFSWDESSRLCDYTHIHSFSYDYYLRVIQDYLSHQQIRRRQFTDEVRRSAHTRVQRPNSADWIGFPDYPVTDFLADLHYLVPNPPVFSRGCLSVFQLSCPVGVCLRPDQVFHHLIEEHPSYAIQIIRMDRTAHGFEPGSEPPKVTPSYTFGILIQHLIDATQSTSVRPSLSRQSSHPEMKGSKPIVPHLLLQSKSLIPPKFQFDLTTAELANDSEGMEQPTFPILPHSVTACVVVDERNTGKLLSQANSVVSAPGSKLNVTVYLMVTDPNNHFPRSRLTSVQDQPYSRLKYPVEWPAVAPFLQPDAPFSTQICRAVPRACSIENAEALAALSVSFSGLCRNRHVSVTLATEHTDREQACGIKSSISGDLRWHVTYLGMWPSHQLRVQHSVELARAAIEQQITSLVSRSGLDCHKNLLWYRLFDMHHYLDSQLNKPSATLDNAGLRDSVSMSESGSTPVEHQVLTMKEIEDLVRSAPFQLDILTLDDRLRSLVESGVRHFAQVGEILNAEFGRTQLQSQANQGTAAVNQPTAFTCLFQQTASSDEDAGAWLTRHMALLSPTFTEGFVLLSWSERTTSTQPVRVKLTSHHTPQNYCNFQLRAVFRTAGDPMNPGTMRRLLDSGHQIQGLFFERSPLAALVTTFAETISFCIWRSLHDK